MSKPILNITLCILALLSWSCQSNKIVSIDFSDGTFKGEVNEHGAKNGKGTYLWLDGSSYKGAFLNDQRHGVGSFKWANGEQYVGEYLEDERTGNGSYSWPDGSSYEGSFLKGKRHGYGIFTSIDGTVYQGEWLNDQQHGEGLLIFVDGRRVQGMWKNGKLLTTPQKLPTKAQKPDLLITEIPQDAFDAESTKAGEGPAPDTKNRQTKSPSSKAPKEPQNESTPSTSNLPESPDTSFLELTSSPAVEEGGTTAQFEPEPIEQRDAKESPIGDSASSDEDAWTGTVEEAEIEFITELINGLDTVRVKKSNKPFSGTMRILNQSGSLQGSVSLKNGLLHGEEIFYESDGSVSERNIWKNGRLVE